MNIAICISGEPRSYEYIKDSIHNIKKRYTDCTIDIFCHLWDNVTSKNIIQKIDNKNQILEELHITDGVIENKDILYDYGKSFWEYIKQKESEGYRSIKKLKKVWKDQDILINHIKNSNSPPLSQLISMCKSNMIRINYERKHNIKYDFVIRTRTDVSFKAPKIEKLINEKNRQRNIIFFPSIHYVGTTLYVEYCFFIGSSTTLDLNIFKDYKKNIIESLINIHETNNTISTRSSHAAVPYFIRLNSNVQLQSGILHFNQHLSQYV
mgnify:CR=1 FL=1